METLVGDGSRTNFKFSWRGTTQSIRFCKPAKYQRTSTTMHGPASHEKTRAKQKIPGYCDSPLSDLYAESLSWKCKVQYNVSLFFSCLFWCRSVCICVCIFVLLPAGRTSLFLSAFAEFDSLAQACSFENSIWNLSKRNKGANDR